MTQEPDSRRPDRSPADAAEPDSAASASAPEPGARPVPPPEPRQRWRLTFARASDPGRRSHRDVADAWLAGLADSGLPLAGGGRGRQPLSFGLALPAGVAVEHELADLLLVERLRLHVVRPAVERSLPDGLELIDIHDVWLGSPAIAAAVAAADYRVTLGGSAARDGDRLAAAVAGFMAASSVSVERRRGSGTTAVDIRPLVADVRVDGTALWVRGLVHPERGAGRPEDVVAALAASMGADLVVEELVRERVLLAEELGGPASTPGDAV